MNKAHSNKVSSMKKGSKTIELDLGPLTAPPSGDGVNPIDSVRSSDMTIRNGAEAAGEDYWAASADGHQTKPKKYIPEKNDFKVAE